jgi:ankyrin repeat protein
LTNGADVCHRNNTFSTSLMIACALDFVDIVKMLLCFGANRHDRTPERSTCLTLAKSNKVKSLLKSWDVTMLMIVLQELLVLSALDPSSFIDLRKFLG